MLGNADFGKFEHEGFSEAYYFTFSIVHCAPLYGVLQFYFNPVIVFPVDAAFYCSVALVQVASYLRLICCFLIFHVYEFF